MGIDSSCIAKMMPFVAMIVTEAMDVGLTTLSKAAMMNNMNHFVFVVYSNAIATIILLPFSYFIQRGNAPHLTLVLLSKFFFLSLIGITIVQNCVYTGINYSSPTLSAAISNLIPAFTFLLALTFRMEKVNLQNYRSQVKILGTVVSISGALMVTLYKGHPIGSLPIQSPILVPNDSSNFVEYYLSKLLAVENNWVVGGLFISAACLSVSINNISQAAILKGFPSQLTIAAFYCLFGTIQCGALTLVVEAKNPKVWKLENNMELFSVIYSGISGGVVTVSAQLWCIHKKGPVFVAMFKPLSIAIAALLGVIFLGDTLYVGSVIGAIVIVIGFYGVIWAQSEEQGKQTDKLDGLPSSSEKVPLLQTHLGLHNL